MTSSSSGLRCGAAPPQHPPTPTGRNPSWLPHPTPWPPITAASTCSPTLEPANEPSPTSDGVGFATASHSNGR
eukprot:48293-Eustigmatos_ZCMA.PRE.1